MAAAVGPCDLPVVGGPACHVLGDTVGGVAGGAVSAVAGNWLEQLAQAMATGAGKILEWTLTWWVHDDTPRMDGSGSVAVWLQDRLLWLTMVAAVVGLLIAAGKLALSGPRAAREAAEGLTRLVVVSAVAIPVIAACTIAGDRFAEWILGQVDAQALGAGFFDLSAGGGAINTTFGPAVLVIVALVGLLTGLVQILLMLVRAAMLIILAGVLPTLAAASLTESGMQAYKKALGWTTAFLLYKPLAALIYAAAFKGLSLPKDDNGGIGVAEQQIIGVLTLLLALVALPALMRAVAPVMSHIATGGGGAKMAGAAGLASGARTMGRSSSPAGGGLPGARPGGARPAARAARAGAGAAGAVVPPLLAAQAAQRLASGAKQTLNNGIGSGGPSGAPPGPGSPPGGPPPGGRRPPGRK